jgi:hypothetical protein
MVRTGVARGEGDSENQLPKPFKHNVHETGYSESWVEGMVVLHNPHARTELPPEMIPGASHEFLQPDGTIISLLPEFHPVFSQTAIKIASAQGKSADTDKQSVGQNQERF